MLSHLFSCTWPGAKPFGLRTSATRQTWTSTLPFAPRAFECQAASSAARTSTGRGSSSSSNGLRTTTWLPAGPATCSQKSRGSATPNVSRSFSASPLPTRIVWPSKSSSRYPLPLLPTPLPRGRHATLAASLVSRQAMREFDLDPEELRRLGARASELVAEQRAALEGRPVFGKVGEAGLAFDEPLPESGLPTEEVLAAVRERILPRPFGNSHPRFFAFINATADPLGIVADYLAASMNSNCWGGDHAAIHVEKQVLRWLAEVLGLPETTEGILTSGGSMANFTALATARRAMAPEVREAG